MFSSETDIMGVAIQFHSDFFCIHRNPRETNCDTVLFNSIYQPPFFTVDKAAQDNFKTIIDGFKAEFTNAEHNDHELLIPHLKIFLVTASRMKVSFKVNKPKFVASRTLCIALSLKAAIEENFKQMHSASDYSSLLNTSPNTLAKLTKAHFNKTLTELITERILIEAKRQLYMTHKPVKEIAWTLGFNDEFYFSRLFKTHTSISPQAYRNTVGFGKAEPN